MDKGSKIFLSGIVIGFTVLAFVLLVIAIPENQERNEYCQLNGYERATSSDTIKIVDKIKYIQCYDEQIINNQFIEIREWIIFNEDD